MKKDIHPKYYPDAKIICACGSMIEVGSTVKEMKVETCSSCHPFYTGKKKAMDTTGRVDRFKKLAEKAKEKKAKAAVKAPRVKTEEKAAVKKTASKKATKK